MGRRPVERVARTVWFEDHRPPQAKGMAESGVLLDLWRAFLDQLDDRQKLRWDECFIDGMFIPAKGGCAGLRRLSKAREQSLWYWPMARVLHSEYMWSRQHLWKSGFLADLEARM